MHDDTRQNPSNLPDLKVGESDTTEFDANTIQDTVLEIHELMGTRAALETFRDQITAAGQDGLDPVARQIMQVNLRHLKLSTTGVSLESIDLTQDTISIEDIKSSLKSLGEKIMALINRIIEAAKRYASKIMSGVETVKTQSEELLANIGKAIRSKVSNEVSNEFHDGDRTVTIDSPAILFANGEFCLDDCRSEQEVIKFFVREWPRYAKEQIGRAKKMISEYDVESGNSDNFNANAGFIGNHESLVKGITQDILPGNKAIAFKYVALGPELIDAEDAEPAPASHTFNVRTEAEIRGTLRKNVATMNALAQMFKEEAGVLDEMATLSKALGDLENRRGETVWKSARDSLDEIGSVMMDLITRLKPNYDPIVRHLAKVGSARNVTVRKELEAAA